MERWDLYDKYRNPLHQSVVRGKEMPKDTYHVIVQVWIFNREGETLISQRHPDKPFGLRWEPTAGSCLSGETSLEGALREVKEELGITLNPKKGKLFQTIREDDWKYPCFLDIYVFHTDWPIQEVVLQDGETVDAKYVSAEEVIEMIQNETFVQLVQIPYYEDILSKYGKHAVE